MSGSPRPCANAACGDTAPGHGYGAMMQEPQDASPPSASSSRWSSPGSAREDPAWPARAAAPAPAASARRAEEVVSRWRLRSRAPVRDRRPDGGSVRDPRRTRVSAASSRRLLFSMRVRRHIGPNRMWVEASRRWALLGVTTLRLDVEAVGDSDGDETPYRDDGALTRRSSSPRCWPRWTPCAGGASGSASCSAGCARARTGRCTPRSPIRRCAR